MNETDNEILVEMRDDIRSIKAILHGDTQGSFGMLQKMNIMWRIHIVWPFCAGSAVIGALGTILVQKLTK